MPQLSTCAVQRCVPVLLVYGEVGIKLLAEVVRGLRLAGDWLPPTLIVKLLASRIRLDLRCCTLLLVRSNACRLPCLTIRVSTESEKCAVMHNRHV